MSQQINLLLPELRPRFDWLALPLVAGAAAAGLVLLLAIGQFQGGREARLAATAADVDGQVQNLQQQVQALGPSVAARKANPALQDEIAALRTGADQRREVLAYVARDTGQGAPGFSAMLQGFARQHLDGVWLVGFGLSHGGLEIRGRLLDPALLPRYIARLNGDAAFDGRRFAALEMKGVAPQAAPAASDSAPVRLPPPHTEFVLRTEAAPMLEKKP